MGHKQIVHGRPIKIASIIDGHIRECLGGMVECGITGDPVIDELDCLAAQRGAWPRAKWACTSSRRAVAQRLPRFVQLPHPRECLKINSLWSLTQAQVVISDWKHDYNHCESSGGWSGTGWQG